MRRILVDHARAKHAHKRGGLAAPSLQLADLDEPSARCGPDPLVLDDALISLAKYDADLCLLVELKHFGGFDMEEIAQIQGKPVSTIYRHWKIAKTHLYRYFKETAVGF